MKFSRKLLNLNFLIAGTLAAIVALSFMGSIKVPLYDGVGLPDEPYRYVNPPAGSKATEPPTKALNLEGNNFYPIENGTNPNTIYASTQEQGAQIQVSMAQHQLTVTPKSLKRIQFLAKPVAAAIQPDNGTIAGNVYEITANAEGGTVTYTGIDYSSFEALRLPQGAPINPIVVYKPAGTLQWQPLSTDQIGTDIYRATFKGFGDYALANIKGQTPQASGQNNTPAQTTSVPKKRSIKRPLIIGLIDLGIVVGIIVWIKHSKRKARDKNNT